MPQLRNILGLKLRPSHCRGASPQLTSNNILNYQQYSCMNQINLVNYQSNQICTYNSIFPSNFSCQELSSPTAVSLSKNQMNNFHSNTKNQGVIESDQELSRLFDNIEKKGQSHHIPLQNKKFNENMRTDNKVTSATKRQLDKLYKSKRNQEIKRNPLFEIEEILQNFRNEIEKQHEESERRKLFLFYAPKFKYPILRIFNVSSNKEIDEYRRYKIKMAQNEEKVNQVFGKIYQILEEFVDEDDQVNPLTGYKKKLFKDVGHFNVLHSSGGLNVDDSLVFEQQNQQQQSDEQDQHNTNSNAIKMDEIFELICFPENFTNPSKNE